MVSLLVILELAILEKILIGNLINLISTFSLKSQLYVNFVKGLRNPT